jgi:hypothetical protein
MGRVKIREIDKPKNMNSILRRAWGHEQETGKGRLEWAWKKWHSREGFYRRRRGIAWVFLEGNVHESGQKLEKVACAVRSGKIKFGTLMQSAIHRTELALPKATSRGELPGTFPHGTP